MIAAHRNAAPTNQNTNSIRDLNCMHAQDKRMSKSWADVAFNGHHVSKRWAQHTSKSWAVAGYRYTNTLSML